MGSARPSVEWLWAQNSLYDRLSVQVSVSKLSLCVVATELDQTNNEVYLRNPMCGKKWSLMHSGD